MPLSKEVVDIFNKKNEREIEHYLEEHQYHQNFDVFIYLNNDDHVFVLCSPKNDIDKVFKTMYVDVSEDDPFQIEGLLFVWTYNLQHMTGHVEDKIHTKFSMFKDLEQEINKLYYIGSYENTGPHNFEFAALKAIPENLGSFEENERTFALKFCEILVGLSDIRKNEKAHEDIMQNIKSVKAKLSKGRLQSYQLYTWMATALGTTIRPSDLLSVRGFVFLLIMLVVYPLLVALMMKFWISTNDK